MKSQNVTARARLTNPGAKRSRLSAGRRRVVKAVIVVLAALGLLGVLATPAQAGTAMVSYTGTQADYTYTFQNARSLTVTLRLRDTACNARSAYAHYEVKREYGWPDGYRSFTNSNGCGTSRTFSSTYTVASGDGIISARFCAGPSGSANCTNWIDSPYT